MNLLKEKKVKIGGVEYPVKMSIRAMILFEELSGHSITQMGETLKEMTFLFYATFKAGGNDLSYDEFMNLIDNNPDALGEFQSLMSEPGEKKS